MALLAAMRNIGGRAEALRQMGAELFQKNELVWEWMRGVHADSRGLGLPSAVAPPLLAEDVRASFPKQGKARMVLKRPSATKTKDWKNVPYVREKGATPGRGLRREQAKWKRTVPVLLAASDSEIVNILLEDKLLVDWTGATCPICGCGTLGELVARPHKGDRLLHRCNAKCCQKHVSPAHLNPIFSTHSGSESPQNQAVILLAKLTGTSHANTHIMFGVNHNAVERIWSNVWADVEADEATFDKMDLADGPEPLGDPTHPVMWEQWLGIVQRGKPRTLTLTRLSPEMAEKRAPGPGAARKVERKPLAERWLKGRDVVVHSDSARSYKLRAPGVIHDFVAHKKKYKNVGGKRIIDRAWRFIKDRLHRSATAKAGTKLLAAKTRSAQYDYWHKDDDLWAKTGEMVQHIMRDVLMARSARGGPSAVDWG
ncbi:unnamed protein product [Prorocentrum cordatum]|uniref:ISXO2-like transposase domain-containing protein n=1 Tax=Prorocentrum cordatum TaxID=2364126 RepID=A0ABN9XPR1_9DINO|nr:unnamed protein product [Polarella glacialis]